jgi:hypothetical protein
MGSDGLPAAIRDLTRSAQQCVETFDKRAEVILGGQSTSQEADQ